MDICKEDSFQRVYYNHAEHLRNYLYYKSGNMDLAQDLVQDAFLKMWENCAKVTFEKAKSFVFTIANNLFLNKMNHEKVVLKFEKLEHREGMNEDPQFIMEKEEFKRKLETAISNLPEDQRVVFLMNRIDKKKYREIAEELNLSIKTIEKRMHNALKNLRKIHTKI